MYPPEDSQPLQDAEVGQQIEHKLMPGFTMGVEAREPCEIGPGREEPHLQYQITDPDGRTDWLCAYDVRAARAG